ncbi:OLC1v1016747C1 [Oldenlandia corymbosa var. corymbosa]|uniref:OLC1v1016747C1 n=1 Tax=Oldenlandia corymbosa var. corymbosa TaxID=529605 RepID=A0AAV1E7U4_OLDCO|nr:OLC1v1016747C1 [Oldenlandia corymbosa var. corymbosa]
MLIGVLGWSKMMLVEVVEEIDAFGQKMKCNIDTSSSGDRATGTVGQGYEITIRKMVIDQNNEIGDKSGENDFSSEEESNNVSSGLQGNPTSLNRPEKQGFNNNFATMANAMAGRNLREKAAAERTKDVVPELMNIILPSGDVFKAANLFTADKDKIDELFNLPIEMRRFYVISLLVPAPSI